LEWIDEIKYTCRWEGETVCAGGGVTNCQDCQTAEIEALRTQLALLQVEVTAYGYCSDLKTQTLAAASAVESDMENLISVLTQNEYASWQTVYNTFRNSGLGCSYIPATYCDLILDPDTQDAACQTNGSGSCTDA
jgi:hypothetical protein